MKLQAPIRVQIQVHVESAEATGVATLNMPYGKYPTEAEIREVVANFSSSLKSDMQLMTKRQFWDSITPVHYEDDGEGGSELIHFAMPGGDDFEE